MSRSKGIRILPAWVCSTDVRTCPDGSKLLRDFNNNCQFPDCHTIPPISPCLNGQCLNPMSGECSYMAGCVNRQYCPTDTTSPFYKTCAVYPEAQCRFTACGGCFEYFVDNTGHVIKDCNVDICSLSPDITPCNDFIPQYFYNADTRQCQQYNYGECGRNANNFNTLQECQTACGAQAGDSCNFCMRPLCPCGLCPDGVNFFGCCGDCIYQSNANGDLQCVYEGNSMCPKTPTITCANVDCKPGNNCYDTSTGPICCHPSICATGGECGGVLQLQCMQGFECVNNPNNPCLGGPTGAGCTGICVNPHATASSCGGFANCANYNDGCNDCVCGNNGMDACTKMLCVMQGTPKCTRCKIGYRLDGNVCVI